MIDKYDFVLRDYLNKPKECSNLLARYLNDGTLSLMLGAGVSIGFGLDGWQALVIKCAKSVDEKFKPKKKYTNAELKNLIDNFKKKAGSSYINMISAALYKGKKFNFSRAKKDLLIAITSLIVGKSRGCVKNIITYNFDSVLEWYLKINGINANVTTLENLLYTSVDTDIIHIHGYIPHSTGYGPESTDVVFSKKEFEDRMVKDSYWKDLMNEFYRRNIFLAIGLSAGSLIDDVCPYVRNIDDWHGANKIIRRQPYGFAFLTPETKSDESNELLDNGIIPCILPVKDIPANIFNIVQRALDNKLGISAITT